MTKNNGNPGPTRYEQKFGDFIRMVAGTKEELVVIHHPEVIVESLNRMADAGKHVAIVPRNERAK